MARRPPPQALPKRAQVVFQSLLPQRRLVLELLKVARAKQRPAVLKRVKR